ncbi:hypothetical protein LCGC14_2726930 [marine sediment metagenome]|uniref:Uncharacterized protein n=1 Tax=marine sediment metagenome TaxID=412755 RepID=A0A0F8ZVV0_9ZZZZ
MSLATGHFQMVQTIDGESNFNLTDKYGGSGALLHANVGGLGTESGDLSYVTGKLTPTSIGESIFRIDTPPLGFSSPIMKIRWLVTAGDESDQDFRVTVIEGILFGGVLLNQTQIGQWTQPSGSYIDLGIELNTWYIQVIPFVLGLVTARDSLWVNVSMIGSTAANIRVSWVALQASFAYSSGETPTAKNYANGLTPITPPPSVRAEGTTGSTSYCYRVVPCNAKGCGPASEEIVVTDGNALLDATNHICLAWADVTGATSYKVYRTCGPSNLGLGLLATVLPDAGDCGGGGSGVSGYKDNGTACVTDCDELFNPGDFVGCQGVSTITYPSKETPV